MSTLVYSSATAMTVTNLHSLASSATAGWQSAVVDNTGTIYMDALVQIVLDFANTAPANSKGVYIFAYAGLETGVRDRASHVVEQGRIRFVPENWTATYNQWLDRMWWPSWI